VTRVAVVAVIATSLLSACASAKPQSPRVEACHPVGAAFATPGENASMSLEHGAPLLVDAGQLWRCTCAPPALAGGAKRPALAGGAKAPALAGGAKAPALTGGAKAPALAGGARPPALVGAAPVEPAPSGGCGPLDGIIGCFVPRPNAKATTTKKKTETTTRQAPSCRRAERCKGFEVVGAGADAYIIDADVMTPIAGSGCYEP